MHAVMASWRLLSGKQADALFLVIDQDGLGSISAEIRGLQQQSAALSLQLNNRKAAQVGRSLRLELPAALLMPHTDMHPDWTDAYRMLR